MEHPVTVAVHVRTYYREDPTHKIYLLNGPEYVAKAMSYFPQDALFIIFSDNIEWCKKNLSGLASNMYFVECEKHYHDFYFMSFCDHNIISNSSFSWWGAYLNKNPNKVVIAPRNWLDEHINYNTKDLYPEGWIVID